MNERLKIVGKETGVTMGFAYLEDGEYIVEKFSFPGDKYVCHAQCDTLEEVLAEVTYSASVLWKKPETAMFAKGS